MRSVYRALLPLWSTTMLFAACGDAGTVNGERESAQGVALRERETETALASGRRPRMPLASPASFDLAASSEGAVLAWAEPLPCARALRVQRLDASGVASGAPLTELDACAADPKLDALRTRVVELAVAAGGGRLGLAWVAREPREHAAVIASHGHDSAGQLARPERLSATLAGDGTRRGGVELAGTPSGGQLIGYRTPSGPCRAAGATQCSHYAVRRHPGPRPQPGRGVDVREVPRACSRMLLGVLWLEDSWYDAVCSGEPRRTTVFVIRPEIAYAEAVEAFPGCEPLGLSPGDSGALLWARCDQGLAVRRLSPGGAQDLELRGVERRVTCARGRPELHAEASAGAITLALGPPRSRLANMLPESLAPPGARAVWTGASLLIATPRSADDEHRLEISRLRCEGDEMVASAPPT